MPLQPLHQHCSGKHFISLQKGQNIDWLLNLDFPDLSVPLQHVLPCRAHSSAPESTAWLSVLQMLQVQLLLSLLPSVSGLHRGNLLSALPLTPLVFIPPLPPPPWPASQLFPLKLLCKPPFLEVKETGTITYSFIHSFFFFLLLNVFWWFLKQKRRTGHLGVLGMSCTITLISHAWTHWMLSKWL